MKQTETTDVVGYVRVSSTSQEDGGSLHVQEQVIRAYCKTEGLRLVTIVQDVVSGSVGIDGRPGLATALAMVETGKVSALVVYKLDRLARDLLLQETIIGRLQTKGHAVLSCCEPSTNGTADPTRDLIRQVLGVIAQYERAMIRQRTAAGRALKAANGGYIGGQPPYGFASSPAGLVTLSHEASTVDLIQRLRTEGLTYRAIAARLDAEGIRTRKGTQWQAKVIHSIINRKGTAT